MKLDSIFENYFKAGEPGGSVLLAQDGKLIYKNAFGLEDLEARKPNSTNTLYNLGSISKTVVAYGILKLAERGLLSLDDDLSRYFRDFRNQQIAGSVKIHHLLTHTSGLPDLRKISEQREFYLTAKDEENFGPIKLADSLLFDPGTSYKYSNPAFNGLALIIEKISREPWQEFIARQIFQPAGMSTSTITNGPHPESGVAHGYVLNDKQVFEELDYGEEPTFAAAGNGGVWSSVEELWKYEQAIQQHKFLSRNWIDSSRTVYQYNHWKDPQPSRLGLSWFINKDELGEMIGHTGSQGGFISDYCWWPERKLFYVLLCNTPKPILEIRKKVASLFQL